MRYLLIGLILCSLFVFTGCIVQKEEIVTKSTNSWGSYPNNIVITADPEIKLNGLSSVFNDVVMPIATSKQGTHAMNFDENDFNYYMDDATVTINEDYFFISLQIPHNYKIGSDIYCHLHAYQKVSSNLSYTLQLNYSWYNINSLSNNFTVITKNFTVNTPINNNTILDFGLINGSGKSISSTFKAKITRKAGDPNAQNLYLDFFDCHYEIDGLGSKQEYIK